MAKTTSDGVYKKTQRQIQKEYNDTLEALLKKNKQYFKTVQAVQNGKIPVPAGLKTEAQVDAWKRGYLRRYMEKTKTIEKMVVEFENAGGKCRKNIQRMMRQTCGLENKSVIKMADADGIVRPMTSKQIEAFLDSKSTAFDRAAFKNLADATTAKKRLRREFSQGLLLGDDDKAMVQRIRKVTKSSESDAMRILETERTRVIGMTQQNTAEEVAKETGKHLKKRWICSFHNSRDSHVNLHGTEVEIDEEFAPNLRYPGDERAPAHETINCRCRMEVFVVGK